MLRPGLFVVSALLLAVLAHAEGPPVNAKALGTTEALMNYCLRASPATADSFRRQVTQLSRGASAETLAAVRRSNEYRKAQSAVKDFVQKVDPHNIKKMCSESVLSDSNQADAKR